MIRIKRYPGAYIPPDIRAIIDLAMEEAPSVAQACKLQVFIKARDTLVVWKKLGFGTHYYSDEILSAAQSASAIAEQFFFG